LTPFSATNQPDRSDRSAKLALKRRAKAVPPALARTNVWAFLVKSIGLSALAFALPRLLDQLQVREDRLCVHCGVPLGDDAIPLAERWFHPQCAGTVMKAARAKFIAAMMQHGIKFP